MPRKHSADGTCDERPVGTRQLRKRRPRHFAPRISQGLGGRGSGIGDRVLRGARPADGMGPRAGSVSKGVSAECVRAHRARQFDPDPGFQGRHWARRAHRVADAAGRRARLCLAGRAGRARESRRRLPRSAIRDPDGGRLDQRESLLPAVPRDRRTCPGNARPGRGDEVERRRGAMQDSRGVHQRTRRTAYELWCRCRGGNAPSGSGHGEAQGSQGLQDHRQGDAAARYCRQVDRPAVLWHRHGHGRHEGRAGGKSADVGCQGAYARRQRRQGEARRQQYLQDSRRSWRRFGCRGRRRILDCQAGARCVEDRLGLRRGRTRRHPDADGTIQGARANSRHARGTSRYLRPQVSVEAHRCGL